MESSFLEKIKTHTDKEIVLAEIDVLINSLYQNDPHAFDSFMQAQVREWVATLVTEGIAQSGKTTEQYLKKLRKEIDEMKEIFLIIAFEPSVNSLQLFSSYVKHECGVNTILNIQYDPEIIAGARIISNSRFRDYSVRNKFDDVIKQFANIQ